MTNEEEKNTDKNLEVIKMKEVKPLIKKKVLDFSLLTLIAVGVICFTLGIISSRIFMRNMRNNSNQTINPGMMERRIGRELR